MYDGTSAGLNLSTHSFTRSDVQRLCDVLYTKKGLTCTVYSAGLPDQYRIRIASFYALNFVFIFRPLLHPSFY
jgi:hypothetical protein